MIKKGLSRCTLNFVNFYVCYGSVCSIYTDVHVLSRSDANQNNLRTSAYEALIDLIKYSAKVS